MEFGSLEEVEVRHLWKHEQYDFSNWLARPESIERLNDVLGLTLTDVKKEVFVGAYRCDLVAKDETTGTKVIIENQLEASNHDHLGKIITYASCRAGRQGDRLDCDAGERGTPKRNRMAKQQYGK